MWVPEKMSQKVAVSVRQSHRVIVSNVKRVRVTHTPCRHTYKRPHLSIENRFPRSSFLADGAVLHPLHWHLILSIQQLQSPAEDIKSRAMIFFSKRWLCSTNGKILPILIKDSHLCNVGLCGLSVLSVGWTSLLSTGRICYIFSQKKNGNAKIEGWVSYPGSRHFS